MGSPGVFIIGALAADCRIGGACFAGAERTRNGGPNRSCGIAQETAARLQRGITSASVDWVIYDLRSNGRNSYLNQQYVGIFWNSVIFNSTVPIARDRNSSTRFCEQRSHLESLA